MTREFEASMVIPTLRAGHDLVKCLESVASQVDPPKHEVIVVFNGPVPPGLNLKNHHPSARAFTNETNLGFAEACNIGAQNAVGEHFVFLNDDMTVTPDWLSNLLKPITEGETAASGGQILSGDGNKIDFDGASVNMLGWGFQKGIGEPVNNDFNTGNRIPFACGGNFAIQSDVFERSGGFDRDYFAFYEDVDLGWRLRLMGEDIAYVRNASVFHNAGSTGSLLPRQAKWFLQERNALQTIIKNYSDDLLAKILPVAIGLAGVRAGILGGIESGDILTEKSWHDSILGHEFGHKEKRGGLLGGLVDGVRESLKAGMKNSRKGSLPDGYLPMDNRGAACLLAVEWILLNMDTLMKKRAIVQAMRLRKDAELLNLFDDPMRPVLGHPREVAAMKPLEKILNDLTEN